MGYFFPHTFDGSDHKTPSGCPSSDVIIANGGTVNENPNGTVTVYTSEGQFVPLNKFCCEALKGGLQSELSFSSSTTSYTFDSDKQECRWGVRCQDDTKPYQLVLNPTGNSGVIFEVDEGNGESCILNVKFDYLFNLDCDVIYDALQENQLYSLDNETQSYVNTLSGRCEEITTLVSTLDANLLSFTFELVTTPYVIECGMVTYCLTEDVESTDGPNGLNSWNTILGVVNYNTWFNSEGVNTSLYTCDDVDTLIHLDGGTGNLMAPCNTSITARIELITQINEIQHQIITLTAECDAIQEQIATLIGDTNCNSFLEMLETLDVSMTLEVMENLSPTTVYEETLFNIGEGNLLDYLISSSGETGFYISGSELNNTCEVIEGGLVDDIKAVSGNLTGIFDTNSELVNLVNTSFNSNWLAADINITDPAIISGITNQEIKISLKINDCCFDLGILIDRIEMNKDCSIVESNTLRISKCPSFDLIRVCDNKKSWLANEEDERREFNLKLRGTGYDIKDYRLAINSKEVDLDINPANAIEQDLYCYVKDNPCLLDCTTGTTSVTASIDYDFGVILSAQTLACEPEFNSGCTLDSIWSISVTLGCETIYSNDSFYVSTGITDTPTQQMYIDELSGISATLGLEFTTGATDVTFTENVNCTGTVFINQTFKINLGLDITTNCNNKQFQDFEFFLFQDGEPYDFN
tara:strand:- start:97 stop:2187 length:2091 start_codon:yes stop_codon:yes gene_type:complete